MERMASHEGVDHHAAKDPKRDGTKRTEPPAINALDRVSDGFANLILARRVLYV
jgi:hypothetical protein